MAQANLLKREGLLLRAKGQELVLKAQKLLPSQPPTKPALREYFEELVNLTQVRQGGRSYALAMVLIALLLGYTKNIKRVRVFESMVHQHVQHRAIMRNPTPPTQTHRRWRVLTKRK